MMALLALLGMTQIHRINAYKTVQNAVCNGVAIIAFVVKGVIYWKHAGIMFPERHLAATSAPISRKR